MDVFGSYFYADSCYYFISQKVPLDASVHWQPVPSEELPPAVMRCPSPIIDCPVGPGQQTRSLPSPNVAVAVLSDNVAQTVDIIDLTSDSEPDCTMTPKERRRAEKLRQKATQIAIMLRARGLNSSNTTVEELKKICHQHMNKSK